MPMVAETLINSRMRRWSKPFSRAAATSDAEAAPGACGWTPIFICAARLMRRLTIADRDRRQQRCA